MSQTRLILSSRLKLARYSVPMILLVRGDIPSKPFLAELTAQAHQVLDRGGCLWMLITGSLFELKTWKMGRILKHNHLIEARRV